MAYWSDVGLTRKETACLSMVRSLVPGQHESKSCSWSCIVFVSHICSQKSFTVCMAHVVVVVGVGVLAVVLVSPVGIVPVSGLCGG